VHKESVKPFYLREHSSLERAQRSREALNRSLRSKRDASAEWPSAAKAACLAGFGGTTEQAAENVRFAVAAPKGVLKTCDYVIAKAMT
jgi:hypothetical protein